MYYFLLSCFDRGKPEPVHTVPILAHRVMPLWQARTSRHTAPYDITEGSENGECENGIYNSCWCGAYRGTEKVKIVLLVQNTWAKFCPGLSEKFGPKMGSTSLTLS